MSFQGIKKTLALDVIKIEFRANFVAGITVAVILIPQAMAYALLAGLPPSMGLYACILPPLAYALLGRSKQLSVGPVALDSLLVASGLGLIAVRGTGDYIDYAILLAVMVGIIQVLFGLLRLGFVVNFLARPVISGFTSAAAVLIGLSQLENILGIEVPDARNLLFFIYHIDALNQGPHWPTFLLGTFCLIGMILMKVYMPRTPAALIALVITTLASWQMSLFGINVAIIGELPESLPTLAVPKIEGGMLTQLFPLALTVAFIGYLESMAITRKYAAQNKQSVYSNREALGLGAANIASGLSSGYVIGGSFSRTTVNVESGAKSQLSGVISSVVIALTLLLFTPYFYYIPKASLAAVILVSVYNLVDLMEPKQLFQRNRKDASVLLFAFTATLLTGVVYGLMLSIVTSILMILTRITRPPIVLLGKIPGEAAFRDLAVCPEAKPVEGIIFFRVDASLYFNNIAYIKEKVFEAILMRDDKIEMFVIDGSSINEIDSSADFELQELAATLKPMGISLCLAESKARVREKTGLFHKIPAEQFFVNKQAAAEYLSAK